MGVLLIAEIKSSISQGDLFTFLQKAAFYQGKHNVKTDHLVVLSPMVDARRDDIRSAVL